MKISRFPRPLSTSIAILLPTLVFAETSAQAATLYYDGVANGLYSLNTNFSTASGATTPDPAAAPGAGDIVVFNISTVTAGQTVLTNGNQAALGLQFAATSGTSSLRASAAGQIFSLGTGGITYGTTQTDIGGTGINALVVSLAGSQSFTGSGSGLIQFDSGALPTQQAITNGTAGAVTLTFDGAGTGSKNIFGFIDDGTLGGTTALTINTTGAFGSVGLVGNNTYSGGTTFTQGFLNIQNNSGLGTGALTFANSTVIKQITSNLIGGLTLTNNNALNLNGTITLGGGQNINFGTGATTLGSATTLLFNGTSNPLTFTIGGAITGANNLTIGATSTNTNSLLVLTGANTGNSTANPITILGQTVRFGAAALPTGNASIVLNGGSLAVGAGSAFTTVSGLIADARVTKTGGAFALTGDSNENITLAASGGNISLGSALGSVSRYSGTLTPFGTAYNVGGGGGTIVFNGTNTFTGTRSFGTNGSNFGTNGGGGTVVINGVNNFDGAVGVGVGTLEVNSIGSVGGSPSALGAPTTAANGTISFGATGNIFSQLRYTGTGETTNRTLNFNSFSGSSSGLDSSGSGAINFAGTFTQNSGSTNRFLQLRGINTGANTIAGSIGITGTAGALNLTKAMRGNWTLTGTNNFAATNASSSGLQVNGGTLTADYSTNASILGATGTNLTLGGGTLAIVNNTPATVATQSIGNGATTPLTTLTANTGQSNVNVSGNGTAGSAVLTIGSNFTRNGGTFLNFDLRNGGQVASTATLSAGGVVVGSSTVAAFTVTDAAGGDFATVSGGQIAKLNAGTALPTAGGSATTNYLLNGSQTQTAATAISTLRIAPTSGGNTLDLGANNGFTSGLGAVSLLKDGNNAYTVTGTTSLAATALVLSNFGTGALTVAVPATTAANTLTKTGPGLVDLTAANAYTGSTSIYGGVLRLSNSAFGTSNITLNTGGILEIGADLNGATAGDFSRQVGTGGSQVQWANGDGGFSAFAANRTVTLTNNQTVAGGQLVWGSTSGNNLVASPNASPAFVRDGFALLLSSSTSDSTLDFTNPIDFVNAPRTVEVGNGTAAVDAVLSGTLSSSDFSGGLHKTGAGTLSLTSANTYTGVTSVTAGGLRANNTTGSATGAGAVNVLAGALLGGAGSIAGPVTVSGTLAPGNSIESLASGALTLNTGSTFAYELDSGAAPAVGADLQVVAGDLALNGTVTLTLSNLTVGTFAGSTKFTLINYSGTYNGGLFTFGAATLADDSSFTFNSQMFTINYNDTTPGANFVADNLASSNYVTLTAVPEPGSWMLIVGGFGLLAGFQTLRRRQNKAA